MPPNPSLIQSRDVTLPSKNDLLTLMRTVENSQQGAQYLLDRVKEIVGKSKVLNKTAESREIAQQVVHAIEKFAKYVDYKFNNVAPGSVRDKWAGQIPPTSAQNYQDNLKLDAYERLKDLQPIQFDYGISQDGNFQSLYTSSKGEVDSDTINLTNQSYFRSWLQENRLFCDSNSGEFYRVPKEPEGTFERWLELEFMGSEKRHETKTEREFQELLKSCEKLSAIEIEELMADEDRGFKAYMARPPHSIEITERQLEYHSEEGLETRLRERQDKIRRIAEEALQKAIEEFQEFEVEVLEPAAEKEEIHPSSSELEQRVELNEDSKSEPEEVAPAQIEEDLNAPRGGGMGSH